MFQVFVDFPFGWMVGQDDRSLLTVGLEDDGLLSNILQHTQSQHKRTTCALRLQSINLKRPIASFEGGFLGGSQMPSP